MDMIVRWGGGRRLSGFLLDALWPDFQPQHLDAALAWFGQQDRTLGG